mmetsp:Transcript_15956/g.30002  ORF Transcript_15956/g.30002 Transcript_15956/m.30002 type:complete len:519 (-) Transcript_15956:185-1741(-)
MAPPAKKAKTTPVQTGGISSFFGPKKAAVTEAPPATTVQSKPPETLAKPSGSAQTEVQDRQSQPSPVVKPAAAEKPLEKTAAASLAEKSVVPPARRVATACSGRFQSGFTRGSTSNWQQYNNLYRLRLNQLAGACREEAKQQWASLPSTGFLKDLSEFRIGAATEIVVVGILFKDMPKRPNVIDEYKGSKALLSHSKEEVPILYSEKDTLWVEDSVMRIQLEVSEDLLFGLATGFVAAVKGVVTQAGTLRVSGLQFPRMPLVPPLAREKEQANGPFIALLSGLSFGDGETAAEARKKAIDFLCGKTGATGQAVQHVVLCGGSFSKSCQIGGDVKAAGVALKEMEEGMEDLVEAKPVQVMPSYGEPTNASLPQLPFHRSLFRKLASSSGFRPVGNPCSLNFEGLEVLGHSGEAVKDLLRCARLEPLQALQKCLEARHLAPTAPDTLMTQPFEDSDPFVLESVPHILFSGGHARAVHAWHPCSRGGAGTQCICVPAFHLHPAVVLVNSRDPRDVRIEEFA